MSIAASYTDEGM